MLNQAARASLSALLFLAAGANARPEPRHDNLAPDLGPLSLPEAAARERTGGLVNWSGMRISASDLGQPLNPAFRTGEQPADAGQGRLRTFELPAITVEGKPASSLREEDRVGTYGQPRWTTSRRFPNTRVYVVPEGKIEVEYWNRATFKRSHDIAMRNLVELEVGLPHRFQLDVYFRTDQDDVHNHAMYGQQLEVRWALADWGRIWGNPTLYFEYIILDEDRADVIEPKLLLGGEIDEGWHWGVNFVGEFEINGPDRVHEYQLTGGLSYTVVDSEFSIGAETKIVYADEAASRGTYEKEYFLGPSVQWRPVQALTVNFAPLFGLTDDTAYAQVTLNVGWEF